MKSIFLLHVLPLVTYEPLTLCDTTESNPVIPPRKGKRSSYRGDNISFEEHLKEKPKIGRNEICNCGSGIKFKNCCINKTN